MTDQSVSARAHDNSPEFVAMKMTEIVLIYIENGAWNRISRETYLDTYAECLAAVRGQRNGQRMEEHSWTPMQEAAHVMEEIVGKETGQDLSAPEMAAPEMAAPEMDAVRMDAARMDEEALADDMFAAESLAEESLAEEASDEMSDETDTGVVTTSDEVIAEELAASAPAMAVEPEPAEPVEPTEPAEPISTAEAAATPAPAAAVEQEQSVDAVSDAAPEPVAVNGAADAAMAEPAAPAQEPVPWPHETQARTGSLDPNAGLRAQELIRARLQEAARKAALEEAQAAEASANAKLAAARQ